MALAAHLGAGRPSAHAANRAGSKASVPGHHLLFRDGRSVLMSVQQWVLACLWLAGIMTLVMVVLILVALADADRGAPTAPSVARGAHVNLHRRRVLRTS